MHDPVKTEIQIRLVDLKQFLKQGQQLLAVLIDSGHNRICFLSLIAHTSGW